MILGWKWRGIYYLLAVVSIGAIGEFDAGVGASELPSTWYPRNGGAFIKEVDRVEELDTFLHDQSHSQNLSLVVIRDQLCWQHFDHSVRVLLLWVCIVENKFMSTCSLCVVL